MIGALLILALVAAALVIAIARRSRQMTALRLRGVRVTGTVADKFATANGGAAIRGRRIVYTYAGPDGRAYRGAASVTHQRLVDCEKGGPIALYVLPEHPGTSAPAWLVDEQRK